MQMETEIKRRNLTPSADKSKKKRIEKQDLQKRDRDKNNQIKRCYDDLVNICFANAANRNFRFFKGKIILRAVKTRNTPLFDS